MFRHMPPSYAATGAMTRVLALLEEVLAMATITVRGLKEEVRTALKLRAERNGRSMEAEVRQILSDEVRVDFAFPNALIKFHDDMRSDPVDLELPERTIEPPRETF